VCFSRARNDRATTGRRFSRKAPQGAFLASWYALLTLLARRT